MTHLVSFLYLGRNCIWQELLSDIWRPGTERWLDKRSVTWRWSKSWVAWKIAQWYRSVAFCHCLWYNHTTRYNYINFKTGQDQFTFINDAFYYLRWTHHMKYEFSCWIPMGRTYQRPPLIVFELIFWAQIKVQLL